ncbi:MAG: hypothetical protein ACK6AD_13885 [Cyanobacteriota bacterium]|jgi:hypothetical protein
MTIPPPPWSLQWTSSGDLAPLDRHDLFRFVCLPGIGVPLASTGEASEGSLTPHPLPLTNPSASLTPTQRSLPRA